MPGHILVDRLFLHRAELIVNPRTAKLCGSKRPCGIRKPAHVARMLRYCEWGTASVFIISSAIFLWMITHFGFLGDLDQGHVVDASTPKMPETKCQCSIAKSSDLVSEWLVNLLFTIVVWLFVSRPIWVLLSHTLAWFCATCFPKSDDDSDDVTSHELEVSDDNNDSGSGSDDGKPVKTDIQRAMPGTDTVMLDIPNTIMAAEDRVQLAQRQSEQRRRILASAPSEFEVDLGEANLEREGVSPRGTKGGSRLGSVGRRKLPPIPGATERIPWRDSVIPRTRITAWDAWHNSFASH
jgi:hypothetical protein